MPLTSFFLLLCYITSLKTKNVGVYFHAIERSTNLQKNYAGGSCEQSGGNSSLHKLLRKRMQNSIKEDSTQNRGSIKNARVD